MRRSTTHQILWPLLAVSLFTLAANDAPWRGQWNWTVDAVVGSTALTGPLTAAAAAYLTHRAHGLAPITASAGRGGLVPSRAAAEATAIAVLIFGAATVVAVTATAATTHGGPLAWWALAMGPAVLAVSAALGASLASLWRHWAGVVLVAPVLFLVASFAPSPLPDLLRHGPATAGLAGLTYAPGVFLLQLLGLAGLGLSAIGVAVLLRRTHDPRAERQRWAAGTLGAALALVAAAAALSTGGGARLEVSAERATACRGSAPSVCVSPSNVRHLARTTSAMAPVLEELRDARVRLPDRYEELLPGSPTTTSGLLQDVQLTTGDDVLTGASLVLTPAGCREWTDPRRPPAEQVFVARDLITGWLLVKDGQRARGWDDASSAWLAEADSDAADQWVRTTFERLRTCRLDEITLPWETAR